MYNGPSVAPQGGRCRARTSPASSSKRFPPRFMNCAAPRAGVIPYTVIREITENFIHADFARASRLDPRVRIDDPVRRSGSRYSRQRARACPGFTTARGEMKRYIRGVGSGLPIVQEYLAHSGGSSPLRTTSGPGRW